MGLYGHIGLVCTGTCLCEVSLISMHDISAFH